MAKYDYKAYFDTFGDVETYYKDAKKKGILGDGEYAKKYGVSTKGWEENWLKGMNKKYGRDAKDLGEYSKQEYTDYHYQTYGKKENRLKNKAYTQAYDAGITKNDPGGSKKNLNDAKVDLKTFDQLLGRLEGSKKRQQRQKSVEGRRDTYAKGLASMMSNF
jgi:hypothetical protein